MPGRQLLYLFQQHRRDPGRQGIHHARPRAAEPRGTNTYTGGTTVRGGTLQYGVANALLPTGGIVNVNGTAAVLDLGGFASTIGTLALTAGTVQNGTLTAIPTPSSPRTA